jgi:hypothetical protein
MINYKKATISNWLIIDQIESNKSTIDKNSIDTDNLSKSIISDNLNEKKFKNEIKNQVHDKVLNQLKKNDMNYLYKFDKSSIKSKLRRKIRDVEEKELIKSPISGTFIIKDWAVEGSLGKQRNMAFSKEEIALNSVAASFVKITPQAKAKLERIPNKIGPYQCKLCKIVYKDAFELAMHNCPRVVHIEYK